jgi:hypothetical protein
MMRLWLRSIFVGLYREKFKMYIHFDAAAATAMKMVQLLATPAPQRFFDKISEETDFPFVGQAFFGMVYCKCCRMGGTLHLAHNILSVGGCTLSISLSIGFGKKPSHCLIAIILFILCNSSAIPS